MLNDLLLAGPSIAAIAGLSAFLGRAAHTTELLEARRPLDDLVAYPHPASDAAILWLEGHENVVSLRAALDLHPATVFVVLVRDMPPSPAFARIVEEHGGVIVPEAAGDAAVASTLIGVLAQRALSAGA